MNTLAITTLVLLALVAAVAVAAVWVTRRRWLAARQQAHKLPPDGYSSTGDSATSRAVRER
ncbi:hypothetical protein [Streptomyces canus]|uniref:hypothetical protein n=1 Tax=Streptomyces canus TaxID=58343 RepID=UPI00382C1778